MEIKVTPRLGEILRERNMTQTALAAEAGIPQAAVSRFDKNEQHKDEHLFRLARALGLKIDDLFKVESPSE